jgi:regulation of enolase protein 1 (concanavalin A-like superfamily)
MEWYNEPPAWRSEGERLTVTTGPDSDFWRVTHYGFVRDSGHFFYATLAGDAIAEVRVRGAYQDLYDQAGLMIRLDERSWVKCGIELVDGVQQVSAVVTRDFSDWSVIALPTPPAELRLRLARRGDSVEIAYGLDGGPLSMLRLAYFPPVIPAQLGVMCASPQGGGFTVSFDALRIEQAAAHDPAAS